MILESAQYEDNAFITLTYAPEHLPEDNNVSPRITSLFIKRLRKQYPKFRYFIVGEYGDDSQLPHYHAALFGFPTCLHGGTRYPPLYPEVCCPICEAVKKAWGFGRIHVGTLTPQSVAYAAGYVNKKMTRTTDPRLGGRHPEFARMSLRPGLGAGMMHDIASTLMEHSLEKVLNDVPVSLAHGSTFYALGRYLRRYLRRAIGRSPNAPPHKDEVMQALRIFAFDNSRPLKEVVLAASEGKRIQIEHRYNTRWRRRI